MWLVRPRKRGQSGRCYRSGRTPVYAFRNRLKNAPTVAVQACAEFPLLGGLSHDGQTCLGLDSGFSQRDEDILKE
jgi:hypothetical protein